VTSASGIEPLLLFEAAVISAMINAPIKEQSINTPLTVILTPPSPAAMFAIDEPATISENPKNRATLRRLSEVRCRARSEVAQKIANGGKIIS
jgi:hypothetical protein